MTLCLWFNHNILNDTITLNWSMNMIPIYILNGTQLLLKPPYTNIWLVETALAVCQYSTSNSIRGPCLLYFCCIFSLDFWFDHCSLSPHIIFYIDVSDNCIGACLAQRTNEGENKSVYFLSHELIMSKTQ